MDRRHPAKIALAIALMVGGAGVAEAGMPSLTLADIERELSASNLTQSRLQAISFFGVCLLGFAAVVQRIWNGLRADLPILPRLSFGKAVGLITLWGLLFMVVLTMISGARELMTPGAWEKKGWTSQLIQETPTAAEQEATDRYQVMVRFRAALTKYEISHDHKYPLPGVEAEQAIRKDLWLSPYANGQPLIYRGGKPPSREIRSYYITPVAYEPASFGSDRLVLGDDGDILWMPIDQIERLLQEKLP